MPSIHASTSELFTHLTVSNICVAAGCAFALVRTQFQSSNCRNHADLAHSRSCIFTFAPCIWSFSTHLAASRAPSMPPVADFRMCAISCAATS